MAAIVAGDILFKYSIGTGAAGNAAAQPSPNASLGKYISTTPWAGGSINDLFDDISGAENAANTVDYRCIFIHNNNAANIYQNVVVYLSAEVAGGASIAIAIDNIAASPIGQAGAQAFGPIANETTAPTGVGAFSSPITSATGLSLGNIGIAQCRAFWVRRTASNSSALSNDGVTIAVAGDTGNL
jgi:hypothetical protein